MSSNRPAFDPREFEVIAMRPCGAYGMFANMGMGFLPQMEPLFNRPITPRENLKMALSGQTPYWIPQTGCMCCDVSAFRPRIIPDNVASGVVMDGEGLLPYPTEPTRSWFGLEWVYVPVAGGATVKPGHPLIEDMNDWEEILQWPDLDALDWEDMGRKNAEYLTTPQSNEFTMLCGFWERLMSLMDVAGAAMALIDEDQQDAVLAFFDKYADFLIDCIRHVKNVCNIDGVMIHDDWGTQNGPFFSLETARRMLLPYLKRVVDYCHSEGLYYEQHSCGNCTKLVSAYIEAGVDIWWPQPMNDFDEILKLAKGTRLHIAMSDPVPMDMPEEEARKAAHEWFARYGYENITLEPVAANQAFYNELYKISREAFAQAE